MNDLNTPVLVTGANGFLGAWIMAGLAAAGRRVVATDLAWDKRRLDQLLDAKTQAAIRWQVCDVTDTAAVQAVFTEVCPSALIHLAALQIPACRIDPVSCARVNVIGQINVFEAARRHGVGQVIYTSSIAAKPRGPANAPGNLYGVFKKTDEEIARIYWEEHGLSSLGLRPHIVYGVGRDDGETSAITRAIRAAAFNESYILPFATRSCFQYAGEVAEIFRRCSEAAWRGALLSDLTTEVKSTDELVAAIRAAAPDADIKVSTTARVSPSGGFDNTPLKSVIGRWPTISLAEGVRLTIEHYRSLGEESSPRSSRGAS